MSWFDSLRMDKSSSNGEGNDRVVFVVIMHRIFSGKTVDSYDRVSSYGACLHALHRSRLEWGSVAVLLDMKLRKD